MRRIAMALLVLVSACQGEAPSTAPTATPTSIVPATAAPRSTVAAPGASYPDDVVPVPEDFEAEADKAITPENYRQKLTELEAAIRGAPIPDAGPP